MFPFFQGSAALLFSALLAASAQQPAQPAAELPSQRFEVVIVSGSSSGVGAALGGPYESWREPVIPAQLVIDANRRQHRTEKYSYESIR